MKQDRGLKKYLIAAVVGILIMLAVCYLKDIFTEAEPERVFRILSDAALLAAVILLGGGFILFAGNNAVFSGIGYSTRQIFSLMGRRYEEKKQSYYEYREERLSKKRDMKFLFIVGGVFLAASVIFLGLFYLVRG